MPITCLGSMAGALHLMASLLWWSVHWANASGQTPAQLALLLTTASGY
jgi:hypothetical protein